MSDLRDRVLAWSRDGALAPAHVDRALRVAGVTPGAAEWRTFVERVLLWLGAVLVAAAAAYFIAANWQALGRYGKFALAESALLVAVALALWRGLDELAGRAALFAAAIATGVLLALVGQVYQTGADTFELFATWAIFIVPFAIVGRQPALWMLALALADVAIVFYFRASVARGFDTLDLVFASRASLWWVTALNVAALIAWEAATAARRGWWSVRWAPRLIATAIGTTLAVLAIQDILEWRHRWPLDGVLGYCAFAAAMVWAYRMRSVDRFMLAGLVASAIVVAAVMLADWIGSSGMFAFLAIGVFILVCGAVAAHWLRSLPDASPKVFR
jgi:uncharacterized membrane protein